LKKPSQLDCSESVLCFNSKKIFHLEFSGSFLIAEPLDWAMEQPSDLLTTDWRYFASVTTGAVCSVSECSTGLETIAQQEVCKRFGGEAFADRKELPGRILFSVPKDYVERGSSFSLFCSKTSLSSSPLSNRWNICKLWWAFCASRANRSSPWT
jgi:hypothetical protein